MAENRVTIGLPPERPPLYRFRAGVPRDAIAGRAEWMSGVQWTPIGCHDSHVWEWESCCPDGVENPEPKCAGHERPETASADPFTIYIPWDCDEPIGRPGDDREPRQRVQLERTIDRQLIRRLHSGATTAGHTRPDPTLVNSGRDITPTSGPVSLAAGFGALLQERGQQVGTWTGPSGLFFGADYLLPAAIQADLVNPGAGSYVAPGGLPWVVGPGLPPTGPDGVAADPGAAWLWLTGPVGWVLSAQPEAMDAVDMGLLRINEAKRLLETDALVRLVEPCSTLAIQVKLECGCC